MAKPIQKSDARLIQEQLEVLQEQGRYFHVLLHNIARTQIAHGKVLHELAMGSKCDDTRLAMATAELKQSTDAIQAAIDAAKPKE